jgi:hypothetical protein
MFEMALTINSELSRLVARRHLRDDMSAKVVGRKGVINGNERSSHIDTRCFQTAGSG